VTRLVDADYSALIRSFEKEEAKTKTNWLGAQHVPEVLSLNTGRIASRGRGRLKPLCASGRFVASAFKNRDGIHKTRDPQNRELRCIGIHKPIEQQSTAI
jgi:hypothetical protein